ncbi:MAG: hypothetical protein ABI863_19900 [Ginsengibacter sp.]
MIKGNSILHFGVGIGQNAAVHRFAVPIYNIITKKPPIPFPLWGSPVYIRFISQLSSSNLLIPTQPAATSPTLATINVPDGLQ